MFRVDAADHPQPPEADIEWLVNEARRYLNPEIKLERKHVLSSWTGVRPLAHDPNVSAEDGETPNTAAASRDHIISYNADTGTVFAAGGKWTTYREMFVIRFLMLCRLPIANVLYAAVRKMLSTRSSKYQD